MADTAAEIEFLKMRTTIQEYAGKWRGYFNGMAAAYAGAYERQKKILEEAKHVLEERKKQEDEARLFALSLLTVGLTSTIGTHFAKEALSSHVASLSQVAAIAREDSIIGEWLVDTMKDVSKESLKKGTEAGLELVGLKTKAGHEAITGEPFVPPLDNPAEYGFTLQQGLEERASCIADIVRLFGDSGLFTAEMAKAMHKGMLQSPFFAQAPPSVMDDRKKGVLLKRAELALWIAWARERDRHYWEIQVAMRFYGPAKSEVWVWAPLRKELIELGVPEAHITAEGSAMTKPGVWVSGA